MMTRTYKRESGRTIKFLLIAAGVLASLAYLASLKDRPAVSELVLESKAAILLDIGTGEVLYEKNADEAMPPASMSKLMTELIVLDLASKGELPWNEQVVTSRYAADVPGSQIGFAAGEVYSVRELFEAMAVHSANDAAVALAEHIGGSERAFVALMNERAAKLGLSEASVFGNSTGLNRGDLLPYEEASSGLDTVLTAKDTATLAAYLLKKYPEVLEVSSRASVKLDSSAKKLQTTNLMLAGKSYAYPGNDGLKTGYTEQAGYCFTGTAKQDGRRLVSVVMGADSSGQRFVETGKLFHYGFHTNGLEGLISNIQSKLGIQTG
ncbi:D-alanyl-D-alanine carboxypeptidase family protein [Paenibacillus harenae]|uniref:D-alanyl-D-alanine carboxypeptidase family protein n=1 Tax=Paenibacillus harenae TaxID=306543 RepID=UPI0003FF01B2|nr:D-alanyl-D-alanine carboxypeptidase family protein [Paenibacillus harenae]